MLLFLAIWLWERTKLFPIYRSYMSTPAIPFAPRAAIYLFASYVRSVKAVYGI